MPADCLRNGDAEPGVAADSHALAAERQSLGDARASWDLGDVYEGCLATQSNDCVGSD
jgi:hypothetical protein